MNNVREIYIGRDADDNVIVSGDNNQISVIKNKQLTTDELHAFSLLKLISILICSIAICGIIVWLYATYPKNSQIKSDKSEIKIMQGTFGNNSPAIYDTKGNVIINYKNEEIK